MANAIPSLTQVVLYALARPDADDPRQIWPCTLAWSEEGVWTNAARLWGKAHADELRQTMKVLPLVARLVSEDDWANVVARPEPAANDISNAHLLGMLSKLRPKAGAC